MEKHKIGLFVLVMFIIGSIDSLRNMPAAAMFGPNLIFFFIVAAIGFLMPIALISAELSSYHPNQNGIYQWSKEAFGDKIALITIWFQWINTAIWFPTILAFIASGLAYLINPNLIEHKWYVVTVILISFWSMTLLSLKNLSISARFAAICAIGGFAIPFAVIAILFIIWLVSGHQINYTLSWHTIIPNFTHSNNWIALTAIITSFLGMELAAVNVKDIKKPQKKYPIGVIIAATIILATMIFGSLAIAAVIPSQKISLISGFFETIDIFLSTFHLHWLVIIMCALVVFSSLGEMINWIVSPARGLQQAAMSGSLPKLLAKENSQGIPSAVLILQAIITTIVCLCFVFFKSINNAYWLLTDLSTEIYVLMYVMMFIAALVLHYKHKEVKKPFTLPGGNIGKWLLCLLGLISCIITLVIGFVPPSQLDFGATWHYSVIFAIGILIMISPALLLACRKNHTRYRKLNFS